MYSDAEYMRHLLDCLQDKRTPAGGLAFAAVWDKLTFDYTPASLNRLSAVLRRIYDKQPDAFAQLQSHRAGQNFLLSLSAYLAEYVGRHSSTAYEWVPDGRVSFGTWHFKPVLALRLLLTGQKDALNLDDTVWQAFRLNPEADRGKMAAFLLEHYRRNRTAPQGLSFTAELAEIELDGSTGSLAAVDNLLAELHEDEWLTPDNFHSRFAHYPARNFLLLIAFYLGETLSALSGHQAVWTNTPQAGDEFFDGFVLELDGVRLPMLRMLEDALAGGRSVFALIKKSSGKVENPLPPEPNQAARRAVDGLLNPDFNHGSLPSVPVAYANELKGSKLDYSLRSLARLDKLLAHIRMEQTDFEDFVQEAAQLNFLHFCAFYLARTAAELSHNTLKFIAYEEAKRQIPDLPQEWFSQYAAVIGERIYFPFGRIASLIWDEVPETSCALFAQGICNEHSGHLYQCSALLSEEEQNASLGDLIQKTLRQAGFTVAYALYQRAKLPENGVQIPLLLEPHPEKHWNMLQLMFDDTDSALEHGMNLLEQNPDNRPCRILCYEGYVNLPRGRFDALMLEIRTYRGNRPFALQAALPFLPDGSGNIAVGSLAVNGAAIKDGQEAEIFAACIYRGMDDFNEPQHGKGYWRQLYRFYL